jgi:hypothetical protein
MAKRKRSSVKAKKSLYKAETYGINFDSMTFFLFVVFVLVASMWFVSNMVGIKLF